MVMRIMKKLLVCVLTLIIVVTAVPVKTVQAASGTNKTSSEVVSDMRVGCVLDVCNALEKGDYETVGDRMYGTHYGMSKLYEVSCEELDFLNDIAKECGVTGSRVMGGGFGGCTINLVKEDLYDAFIATAKKKFAAKFGHEPKVYDVIISDGARRL